LIVYLDTSALVKMFVFEDGSPLVDDLRLRADALTTSRIAYVEACAALKRRRRENRLGQQEYMRARQLLAEQWADFATVEINEIAAGEFAAKHNLRGLDAIHIEAAMAVRTHTDDRGLIFCTFDERQAEAARAERFVVMPA